MVSCCQFLVKPGRLALSPLLHQRATALWGSNAVDETPAIPIRSRESSVDVSSLDLYWVLIRFIQLNPLSQQAVDMGSTSKISINIRMLQNLSVKSENITCHTACFLRLT